MGFYVPGSIRIVVGPDRDDPECYSIYEAADEDDWLTPVETAIHESAPSIVARQIAWSELRGVFMPE